MSSIPPAILFGLIAAGVAILALVLVQRAAGFTRRNAPLAAAFAGGLVITVAVTHLIPESLVMSPGAPWLILLGFGFGFLMHALLGGAAHDHSHGESAQPTIKPIAALAPVFAISMHSVLDGLIYSVTFAVNADTAMAAVLGLVIHEFPETLICFMLLQRAGLSNLKATVFAFLAAGATTLTAAVVSAPFADQLDPQTLGILFAIVAGLLLHVGAAHLLEEAGRAGPVRGVVAVLAGAGVAVVMALTHSHDHDHGHGHGGHDHGSHQGHDHDDHDHAPIGEDHNEVEPAQQRRPSLRAVNPDLQQGGVEQSDDAGNDTGHDHDHEDGSDHDHR